MAVWTGDEPEFRLIQNLSVSLFFRPGILNETVSDLASRGYYIVELDCAVTEDTFHGQVADLLDFPSYYGQNMAALNDCLRDVAAREYGVPTSATGLVVVLWHVDESSFADHVLNIFWFQSLCAALRGNRMMILAQTGDPHYDSTHSMRTADKREALVWWNGRESSWSSRP
ncbi:MAG: barstar family protein [Propionibacteriaceae bacterium]|nr:barstar family protein [Propionibacteriaceae bacterium]